MKGRNIYEGTKRVIYEALWKWNFDRIG